LAESKGKLAEAQSDAFVANRELAAVVRRRTQDGMQDAFSFFLATHACISRHVLIEWPEDPSMLALNTRFVERGLAVCRIYEEQGAASEHLSPKWASVLRENDETPHNYSLLLARMAYVHILEDLVTALDGLDVKKEDYDDVYGFIVACLERLQREKKLGNSALGEVAEFALAHWAGPVRNLGVRKFREAAWNAHRARQKRAGAA
jgi:hypothetical protein